MCEIETAVQIAHRMVSRTSSAVRCLDTNLFPEDGGPAPGELVELTGKTNCGKSVLMLELIARIILPMEHGGHGVGAVFVNCDNNVHMLRLLDIMEKQIVNNSSPAGRNMGREEIRRIREESFSRLTMIKCCTMDEFEFTLLSLNDVFLKHPAASFLLIDSLVAFYWNKCTEKNLIRMDTYLRSLCVRLDKLCKELQLVAIFTRPSYFGTGRESTSDGLVEGSQAGSMAAVVAASSSAFGSGGATNWKQFVKHRVELTEAVTPTPSEDRKFNAFVTSRERQLIKFFLIDAYGISWLN